MQRQVLLNTALLKMCSLISFNEGNLSFLSCHVRTWSQTNTVDPELSSKNCLYSPNNIGIYSKKPGNSRIDKSQEWVNSDILFQDQ